MEPSTASPAEPPLAPPIVRRGDRALPLVLLVAAALVGAALAAFRPDDPASRDEAAAAADGGASNWIPSTVPAGETASLTVDFGNGARRVFDALPWREGMTVGDLMREAQRFRPPVRFTHRGAGEMAFLTSLEGVANEGGDGRYWSYSVDGRRGETSYEVQPVGAGAAVVWRFRSGG